MLVSSAHRAERVESASKITCESVASQNNLLLNLITLFTSDTRAERIVSKVATNTDACRLNHGCVLSREGWALKLGVVHVTYVLGSLAVTMVLLNNLVHQRSEGSVGVMAASVDTNTGVCILGTREDSCLERDTTCILLVLKQIPHSFVKILAEKRCGSSGENGKAGNILRFLKMGTSLAFLFSLGRSSCLCRGSTTTKLLLLSNHSLDTVVHVLDKFNLATAESPLIRDIVDVVSGLRVLTVDATDLDIELISNFLEFCHLDAKFWKSNMN